MPGRMLSLAWLDELTAALKAGGIRSVATDPADLNPPGVLIKVTGFIPDLLDGWTPTADLFCVVPDADHDRALAALTALANLVLDVVDPAGAIRAAAVQLPDTGGRLPALVIPYDDPTDPTP